MRPEIESCGSRILVRSGVAISLGSFAFWTCDPANRMFRLSEVNRLHEYGHSIQSMMLGPFYLPVVGLPSLLRGLYARIHALRHGARWEGNYRGFPEDWADRLGGVDFTLGLLRTPH